MIMARYGIPRERVLYSRDLSFAGEVRRLTAGRGVDVVLNSLAGDALVVSWECVAPFGRFVEIGKRDIFSHGEIAHVPVCKECIVLRGGFESCVGWWRWGIDRGCCSKGWQFEGDGRYVIAGGLGAMGRVIAEWMAAKGVGHLVLLSRSGATSAEALAFIERLQSQGAAIYSPVCDAADGESLRAVLDRCKAHMPPIKGCIQVATVLRDSFFEDMDHESWSVPLKSKIDASWSLHKQLTANLDFFVLFSSVAAIIGSQAQANYAAGNTFQDELSRHRISKGLRTLSVNLSLVGGLSGSRPSIPIWRSSSS
ncbi:uncharacterized protein PODANS_0_490 [Podospora anserina S mat+]|uniref:Podospora anserina S mat+ genomic DNA chromosome 4, supercontig 2 n=1 Tax=Podospora anserina (strain S / ATCC MYA-4624 / DSM 980 / FGSC 10383) TaxID=515849 RepID=B2ADY2_PODAN|nr:uncharacterized protein PODANS_0_490 [Podospora anserina S mat+]CAP61647.1 unnamed protein product [Podospora anserina S mat+]